MANLILLSEFQKTQIELWKPIDGFLGYEISNLGRLKSLWRKSGSGRSCVNGQRRGSWTYVLDRNAPTYPTGELDKDGYRSFALSRRGYKVKRMRAHRLVAQAFILNQRPIVATKINHKNNVHADNRQPNLEWCTEKENREHAIAIGVWPSGIRHGLSKVSEEDVRNIRLRFSNGEGVCALGRAYNMSSTAIGYIVTRRHYKNID